MNDYNYCTNRTNKDTTADKVLNTSRLGWCQWVIQRFVAFMKKRQYVLLSIEIWDKKKNKIYKMRDLL